MEVIVAISPNPCSADILKPIEPECRQHSFLELVKSTGRIAISDVVVLTEANRNIIKKHLEALLDDKHLLKHVIGKATGIRSGDCTFLKVRSRRNLFWEPK